MADGIAEEIIGLITSENVVGLATHRHYPREKMIYSRFGRCGFAIDVVKFENGVRRTYSILVEAEADVKNEVVQDFLTLPGKIRYILSTSKDGGKTLKTKIDVYSDAAELFRRVEEVRQIFYRVYHSLKQRYKEEVAKIGEEVFHAVGLTSDELHLGV